MLTRRQMMAAVGAGLVMPPFLRRRAWAADAPARKLVLISSLGTQNQLIRPTSAAGAPLALQASNSGLLAVKEYLNVVDGISFSLPTEGHGSPIPFTGKGYSSGAPTSIDQFILAQQPATTPLPMLSVGAAAISASHFYKNGQAVVPIDDPSAAFISVFGAGVAQPAAAGGNGQALPRQAILSEVSAEVKALGATLGPGAKTRLDQHLASLNAMATGGLPAAHAASCTPVAPAAIGDGNAENAANTLAIGQAQLAIILSALACGATHLASMQWGTNQTLSMVLPGATQAADEHTQGVHGSTQSTPSSTDVVNGIEQALSAALVTFIKGLATTPDPSGSGMLIDNTLVFWTRDFGYAPNHTSFSVPSLFAGGKGYLKTSADGVLTSFGGDDSGGVTSDSKTQVSHECLLLNCAEWMGVTNFTGFGLLTGSKQAPAAAIKAG